MDHVREAHAERAEPHVLIEVRRADEADSRPVDVARFEPESLGQTLIAERMPRITLEELDRL